jgi:hypothetical protein
MPIMLHLHQESDEGYRKQFRASYELRQSDCELYRSVDRNGDPVSPWQGGVLRMVVDGQGDETLLRWVTGLPEDGEIVTINAAERVIEKLGFARARVLRYRLHFDSYGRGVTALVTAEAKVISTENDIIYQSR